MQPCDSIRAAVNDDVDASPRQTRVFSRQGCHLCDVAVRLLTERGLVVELIDIDQDDALLQQFDECVPVVEIGGKIRFRGSVNPILLDRIVTTLFSGRG